MEVVIFAKDALTKFIDKYGVEPSGFLMNEHTFDLLKAQADLVHLPFPEAKPTHIFGILIYRSNQMENNEIRFVI